MNTTNPDAEIFHAIERWRALLAAADALPDSDPAGRELYQRAFALEPLIAKMVPTTPAAFHAWVKAIHDAAFDDTQLLEINFRVGFAAGRLGLAGDPPDLRAPQ